MTDNSNVQNKIDYLSNLWTSLIDNFLKKSFGLNLYNPHILVEDIITEIEENSFNNGDNKKYFYNKLNEYFSSDVIIKNHYYAKFKLLRANFSSVRIKFIHQIAKDIILDFKKGDFFDKNIHYLNELITNNEPLNDEISKQINLVIQNLIIEFLKKGYILKEIREFIHNIFDNYRVQNYENEEVLFTRFPHGIKYSDFETDGHLDRIGVNKLIIDTMNNLTVESRVQKLSSFYYREHVEANYIFIVEGLKGNIKLQFDDVTFYSVENDRIAHTDTLNEEDLQENKTEKYIQASVKVDYSSPKSSFIEAITKIENAIDFIHCYYSTKTKIEVNPSRYIVIQNGKIISRSWGVDKNDFVMKYHDSLNLNRYEKGIRELNKFSFLFNHDKTSKILLKLSNAVRWYSKAEHSITQEDKMLNYWIALENLFSNEYDNIKNDFSENNINKIKLIQIIINSNQMFFFIYDYGWEIYYHYSHIVRNQKNNTKSALFPEDLITSANLIPKEGETIYLKKFIDSLEKIKIYEKNIFLLEKIDDLIKFYGDNTYTHKSIKKHSQIVEDDILMIYRFRNLIVHNAHFDNSLLPYYVWKIKEYSGNLMRKLIVDYEKNPKSSLSDLLINTNIKKEKFLIELEANKAELFSENDI